MGTDTEFLSRGIVKSKGTHKALDAFARVTPDFTILAHLPPSQFVTDIWNDFISDPNYKSSLNGKVFEYILIALLINKGVLPLYVEARAAFVPNVNFDLLLYSKERPIVLSAKTSLRERYKQADLEAIALKYVHRKAKTYLLTLDDIAAASVNKKIRTGDVIGIDEVILANSPRMDSFVQELLTNTFTRAGKIEIVQAQTVVV